jgi:hypothetical protein
MTLPHVPGTGSMLPNQVVDIWKHVHEVSRNITHGGLLGSLALQSFPSSIAQRSTDTVQRTGGGGNAMGLKKTDGPRFIIEVAYIWMFAQDDEIVEQISRRITNEVGMARDIAVSRFQQGQDIRHGNETHVELKRVNRKVELYNPHFLNDAMFDQKVLQSYDEYTKFARLQREVDPTGYWRKNVGGFKY